MPLRLQFVVMSSGEDNQVLSQLLDALSPWPVLIHQDASRPRPPMQTKQPHRIRWVRSPKATGWGDWGFATAIVQSLNQALNESAFDYLQLLSPSCLPIRPIADLIIHVGQGDADHHVDAFALDRDWDTWMSFAWRAYAPQASDRQRVLSRLRRWYFGQAPELEQQHSMSVLHRRAHTNGGDALRAAAAVAVTKALGRDRSWTRPRPRLRANFAWPTRDPEARALAVGSVWFGARREVCERMVQLAASSVFRQRFEALTMVDELVIPTLLRHSGHRSGPSNHSISPFDGRGHPVPIDPLQLIRAQATGRFFARKFRAEPDDPCRWTALDWAGCGSDSPGSARGMPRAGVQQGTMRYVTEISSAPPGFPGFQSSPGGVQTG